MSLDAALSGALSSLQTVQRQISVISNNINNANTPGYTRKTVQTESVGNGVTLVGVKISNIARTNDETLQRSMNISTSNESLVATQQEYLARLQGILGTGSNNVQLTNTIQTFAADWNLLQAEPESVALQNQIISDGTAVANTIKSVANQIEQLDRSIISDISGTISQLNSALQSIQKLNAQIADAKASGLPIGDYQDQRDQAINLIAQFVDIRVMQNGNDQIAIFTPQGFNLLNGDPEQFAYDGVNLTLVGSSTSVSANLTGGKLEALLNLRADSSPAAANTDPTREVIRKLRNQLDQLANGFLAATTSPDSFAQAYNSASTGTGELASGFFTGTDRTNITVNSALIAGTSKVKQLASVPVATAMSNQTRSFTAAGVTISNVSYASYAQSIVSQWQTAATQINSSAEVAKNQKDYYSKLFTDKTSVNVDEEMVRLQVLQLSYQAAARLIGIVQQMNQTITDMVR
ncbi:MAG: flagellar hook-associated protein FlgK [Alphaproteobacteria bacterium]